MLLAALGTSWDVEAGAYARPDDGDVRVGAEIDALRDVLCRVATTTGGLATAALRASTALSTAGRSEAADVADGVSTCAQALRILAELELDAIRAP